MSIAGRTNVDIVFHDMSGTTSIKIVEMESSDAMTSGKVAMISATHGATSHTINTNNTGYYDASGTQVSFSTVTRIGLKASRPMTLADNQSHITIRSDSSRVSFSECSESGNFTLTPIYTSGTASYTVFLYGT